MFCFIILNNIWAFTGSSLRVYVKWTKNTSLKGIRFVFPNFEKEFHIFQKYAVEFFAKKQKRRKRLKTSNFYTNVHRIIITKRLKTSEILISLTELNIVYIGARIKTVAVIAIFTFKKCRLFSSAMLHNRVYYKHICVYSKLWKNLLPNELNKYGYKKLRDTKNCVTENLNKLLPIIAGGLSGKEFNF